MKTMHCGSNKTNNWEINQIETNLYKQDYKEALTSINTF